MTATLTDYQIVTIGRVAFLYPIMDGFFLDSVEVSGLEDEENDGLVYYDEAGVFHPHCLSVAHLTVSG